VQGAGLKPAATLLCAVALAALLCACGGGGGTQPTTNATTESGASNAPTAAQAQGQSPLPGHPKIAPGAGAGSGSAASGAGQSSEAGSASPPPLTRASARRAEARAEAVQAARHRALAKQAGHAAPFLVPTGDNSIPTYGSEASASQQAEATTALSGYLAARAADEWSTACAEMAATVTKQLALLAGEAGGAKPSCADAYAKLSERVPASQRVSPLSGALAALRVEADKAFALFYGPHEQQYMMPMVSEAGAWKVNQIEPIPWPIGAPSASP
jgi:hypothetical protein